MALKVGELYAALSLTKDKFKSGLDGAERDAKGFATKLGGSFQKVGKAAMIGLGIAAGAFALIAAKGIENAVEQERADRMIEQAYGKAGAAVNKWAADNAMALGVADDQLQAAVGKFGIWAQNVGMTAEQAASSGEALAKRAAEISAATGKPFEEVFGSLLKGAQGATKGLKDFGVAVDPALIKQTALKMGLWDGKGALDAHAKAMALENIILQQTAGYTDAAAKAHDGLAFKQQQLGVASDMLFDSIGAAVLPLVTMLATLLLPAFMAIADWVTANQANITGALSGIAAIAGPVVGAALAAIGDGIKWAGDNLNIVVPFIAGPLVIAFGAWALTAGAAAAATLLALAPLILIGAAVGAVAVAFTNNWGGIRDTVMGVVEKVTPIIQGLIDFILSIAAKIAPVVTGIATWASQFIGPISELVGKVAGFIGQVIGVIVGIAVAIAGVIGDIVSWASQFVGPISELVGKVAGFIAQVVAAIVGVIAGIAGVIGDMIKWAGDLVNVFSGPDGIVSKIQGFVNSIVGFFIDLPNRIVGMIGDLVTAGGKIVQGIIDGFVSLPGKLLDTITSAFTSALNSIHIDLGPFHVSAQGVTIDLPHIDLPKFAVGAWNIPRDMVAEIHKGEMIIPARAAARLRSQAGAKAPSSGIEAAASSRVTGLSGNSVSVGGITVVGASDPEETARSVLRHLKRELNRQGMSLA